MPCSYLVLDPALIGLSLAYSATLTVTVQYALRLSGEVENLVRTYKLLYIAAYINHIPSLYGNNFQGNVLYCKVVINCFLVCTA